MVRWRAWVLCVLLAGCHAQRPDVPGEAARLTGVEHAIVFHEQAEPVDLRGEIGQLTPARAVRLALEHDPRIQSAIAKVRAAEADANQARLLPNPIFGVDVRMPTKSGSNVAVETTLNEDLLGILQKPTAIRAADARLRAAASDALTTVLDVVAEVQTAYATAQSIEAGITNAEQRREILQKMRDIAQKRLDLGDATRLDVITLEAQVMQASFDLADLRLQRTEQRLMLARLIGRPRAAADWQLSAAETLGAPLAHEGAWIDAALRHRPEIRAKIWELSALGEDLSGAAFAEFQGSDGGVHAEHDPQWRLGPTLTTPLPIFDWGQEARAKIAAQRVAARHDLLEQQREVIQDVRVAYATYAESQRTLAEAREKLLPLQKQQLDQAQRAYQAGEVDLATLLLAQNDYQLGLSRMVDLSAKLATARIKLERAAGGAGVAGKIPATANNPTSRPAKGDVQ
jgi:outer membrane protein, heavy metal efflux system